MGFCYFYMFCCALHSLDEEERAVCFAFFVFLTSCYCCVYFPHGAMGLSAVCDCGISWSYALTVLGNMKEWENKVGETK